MNIIDEKGKRVNYGVYESTEVKMANMYIQPDDYVLELGARYGGVSCTINQKLSNKKNQVVVEPDSRVWDALETNRKNNKCEFEIIKGTISQKPQKIIKNSRKFNDNNDWATYCEEASGYSSKRIQNYDLPDKPFNVLVADCEGFLETFYRENMELFPKLRCIMIEKDRPDHCNYDYLENEFIKLGFEIDYIERDGFHTTYVKKNEPVIELKNAPKIFFINLESRHDRRQEMIDTLKGYDYERVEAVHTPNRGYIGCVLSHIKCLSLAKERKYDSVIILEDDFIFKSDKRFDTMDIPQTFDMLLLSNLIKQKKTYDETYDRVFQAEWTSGYSIKNHFYDTLIQVFIDSLLGLLKNYCRENYLDVYWKKIFNDSMILTHKFKFGGQKEGYSDIRNEKIKRK